MSKLYMLELFFKNGKKVVIPPKFSKEEVINHMNRLLNQTTRYYKHNGIDYGIHGKIITFEEENGGLNLANICVYEKVNIITITE